MYGRIKKIHFVGIGGSGMSGIAEVLINLGYSVSGSDIEKSTVTMKLEKMGARIYYQHLPQNVVGCDVVVMSSAIKNHNVEIVRARELGIPVIPRAEMLGELMRLKYGIAVTGSHGKTTTTSMIESILTEGGLDPTAIIGGKLISYGSGAKLGSGKFLVAEADESDGSFVKLTPSIVVVTGIDEEHLDHYGSYDELKNSFIEFTNRIPFYGLAVLCIDDRGVIDCLDRIEKRVVTYGFSPQAQLTAKNVRKNPEGYTFTVVNEDRVLGDIILNMKGEHNILNALAAVAVGIELEIDFEAVYRSLKNFKGVHRRLEVKGEKKGVIVIDDYAHHPTEIENTLKAVRDFYPERKLIVIFQPHRYTRTKLLKEKFSPSLNLAEILLITEVYPAGETPIEGATGYDLFKSVASRGHRNIFYVETLENALDKVKEILEPNTVILTLGAGNIYRVGEMFLEENR